MKTTDSDSSVYWAKTAWYYIFSSCFMVLFFWALTGSFWKSALMAALVNLYVSANRRVQENRAIAMNMDVHDAMKDKAGKQRK